MREGETTWDNDTKNKKNGRVLKYIKNQKMIEFNILFDMVINFKVLGNCFQTVSCRVRVRLTFTGSFRCSKQYINSL